MYLSFYGLSEKPFGQTPDPKFLYWNDAYRETIASLRYGIQERKGFITMIGEAGTGKTTLLRKLLDDLGPDVVSVFLFNPNATFEEILEYTLGELGIPAPAGRKLAMLQRLNEFLLAAFQEGKNTILLIDEAQDLETEVLESLRLLSNLETSKEKILQIVLSGQPELATCLAQPNLRQLKQRIAVRCRLEPLARKELPDYIAARLAVAGGRPDLFAPATLDPIWDFARGIPRLVNAVCDNALLVGYALGRQTIEAEVIGEVVADLTKIDAPLELPPVPAAAPIPGAGTAQPPGPAEVPPAAPRGEAPLRPEPAACTQVSPPAAPVKAPAAAAASPDLLGTVPGGSQAPTRGSRRRTVGSIVTAGILLVLAAVGALAASRWEEIRPRVRALLTEPGDEAADRIATAPTVRQAVPPSPREIPPLAPAAAIQQAAPNPVAQEPAPAAAPAAVAPVTVPQGTAPVAAMQGQSAVPSSEPAAPAPAAVVPTVSGEIHAAVPALPAEPPTEAARPTTAEPVQIAALLPAARSSSQDLQPARRPLRGAKRVLVQRGDTLTNLTTREYGAATYTLLDVVRSANPGIQDVDRIIAGSEIVMPDPGPFSRVTGNGSEFTVLVGTTPALAQAQELQRMVGARYRLPADLEPIPLGEGRNLYRVSLRNIPDSSQARQIAESLGTILRDPS